MSVIVAKRTKDGFILAGDSICCHGTERRNAIKIFKANRDGDVIIGGVGYLRDINIISTMDDLIDANAIRREELDYKSIVTYTVPALQKELKEVGRLVVENGILCWESVIIIAYKDKAFIISEDFTVQEISDFDSIGAPEEFAKGAYYVLKKYSKELNKVSDWDIVKEIMKMVIEQTYQVFYPIRMIDTSKPNPEFVEIKGEIVEVEEPKVVKKEDK